MNEQLKGIEKSAKPVAAAPHAIERLAGRRAERGEIMTAGGGAVVGSAQRSSEAMTVVGSGQCSSEPRATCGVPRKKISERGLRSLPFKLSERERVVLKKMFREVALPTDEVFYDTASRVAELINRKFSRHFGAPGIVQRTLHGKHASSGFYWLALNPELFEVEERKPEVGVHYRIRDVFHPGMVKIVDYLARNNYSPRSKITREAGVKNSTFPEYVCRINKYCRRDDFPEAIATARAGKSHTLFCVTREFAQFFGLKLKRKLSRESFSKRQLEVIDFLAGHPESGVEELAALLHCSKSNIIPVVKGLNEIALLYGVKAVVHRDRGHLLLFSLTPRIASALKIEVSGSSPLKAHFTPRRLELIEFIAAHPNSTTKEIGKAIGMSVGEVSTNAKRVEKACEEKGLPAPFERVGGKHDTRYCINEEFSGEFDLPIVFVSTRSIVHPAHRRVYDLFAQNPGVTVEEAAKRMGVSCVAMRSKLDRINRLLQAHGRQPITRRKREAYQKELRAAVGLFFALRKRDGRWPTAAALKQAKSSDVVEAVRRVGGFERVQARAWTLIPEEERKRIVETDAHRIQADESGMLASLDGKRGETVEALVAAIRAGIDLPTASKMLAQSNGNFARKIERNAKRYEILATQE